MKSESSSLLKVNLLGEFHVSYHGEPVHFSTRESESTCAFLILHRRRIFDRKRVLDMLFPDLTTHCAQKRLRTDIWRIKAAFEAIGLQMGSYFQISSREVGFLPTEDVQIDIEEFEQVIPKADDSRSVVGEKLAERMNLYRGDLLEGFNQDWCIWEKERIKMQYLRGLEALMEMLSAREDWQRAIEVGKNLVTHDPLREHVHRQIMRFFYALGDRPAAIKQYYDCRDLLADELNVDPMQSTQSLFEAIENESLPRISRSQSPVIDQIFSQKINEIQKKLNEVKVLASGINCIYNT